MVKKYSLCGRYIVLALDLEAKNSSFLASLIELRTGFVILDDCQTFNCLKVTRGSTQMLKWVSGEKPETKLSQ